MLRRIIGIILIVAGSIWCLLGIAVSFLRGFDLWMLLVLLGMFLLPFFILAVTGYFLFTARDNRMSFKMQNTEMKSAANKEFGNNRVIVFIGLVASIFSIFAFITGYQSIPALLRQTTSISGSNAEPPSTPPTLDERSGLYSISWSRVEHSNPPYGNHFLILTVVKLLGPKGASINNIVPGKYIVRGTYDLRGSAFTTGYINLDIEDDDHLDATSEMVLYEIPNGQLYGDFEVMAALSQPWFFETPLKHPKISAIFSVEVPLSEGWKSLGAIKGMEPRDTIILH